MISAWLLFVVGLMQIGHWFIENREKPVTECPNPLRYVGMIAIGALDLFILR